MAILKGRADIIKRKNGWVEVRLGQPGWKRGDSLMYYGIRVYGPKAFKNIAMDTDVASRGPKYREWPPTKIFFNIYALEGMVTGYPYDKFLVFDPERIEVYLWKTHNNACREFDLYYNGKLVAKGVRSAGVQLRIPWWLIGLGAITVAGVGAGVYLLLHRK